MSVFTLLENRGILHQEDELGLFCLHHVYMPRLKDSLLAFQTTWNCHPLSTCQNRSPLQLRDENIWLLQDSDSTAMRSIRNGDWSTYGRDDEGQILPRISTDNNVVIPRIQVEHREELQALLNANIDPLEEDYEPPFPEVC